MAGTARVTRLHTCPHADSTGELQGAGKAEDQAHLLGHSASQVLQHVQHLEDVKRTHHLDPLESSCLKGQEKEGRALEKRSRGSRKMKRDFEVEREEALRHKDSGTDGSGLCWAGSQHAGCLGAELQSQVRALWEGVAVTSVPALGKIWGRNTEAGRVSALNEGMPRIGFLGRIVVGSIQLG